MTESTYLICIVTFIIIYVIMLLYLYSLVIRLEHDFKHFVRLHVDYYNKIEENK
jgi:hypothetical protein